MGVKVPQEPPKDKQRAPAPPAPPKKKTRDEAWEQAAGPFKTVNLGKELKPWPIRLKKLAEDTKWARGYKKAQSIDGNAFMEDRNREMFSTDDVDLTGEIGVAGIQKATEAGVCDRKLDMVNHPPHYTNHPSGIECIQIVRHMGFNLGSALKYIWRCDLKHDAIEDLKKAIFYIKDEIKKRGGTPD